MLKNDYLRNQLEILEAKHPNESEYHQAVEEVLLSIDEVIDQYPEIEKNNIVGRLLEPERIIAFRVAWMNQKGEIEVNRGYRVQYNSALGIYKGGIRFHPSVNLSIMKFLAFEQTFKNAITLLPMGGGKGGSDFNPKNRSDEDVMRFCQAFISELYRHIGDDLDVPAGDLGVGKREIGYMYGYFKKLKNEFNSAFTGKGLSYGGSQARPEATGFGLVYFVDEALKTILNTGFKGKRVIISGAGNVALFAAQKVIEFGGVVIAMSDTSGMIYHSKGLNVDQIRQIKNDKNSTLQHYLTFDKDAKYSPNNKDIWSLKADIALPCATQNELDHNDVAKLIENGVLLVAEGANMPTTKAGIDLLKEYNVIFCPAKAANAGGVLVSGIEISQNHQFYSYSFDKVDRILSEMMRNSFHNIFDVANKHNKKNDLLFGANVFSFLKVALAMIEQGII